MKKILFLDDDENRANIFKSADFSQKAQITWVKTAKEAIEQLSKNSFEIICLDHDLGGKQMVKSGPETGYQVAEFISKMNFISYPEAIFIHTFNPFGAVNMLSTLMEFNTYRITFGPIFLGAVKYMTEFK